MKILIVIIIMTISAVSIVDAQNFNGQIFDAKTKESIPFVNIGVINKGIGTISDENGIFLLRLDDKYNDDSLKISMVGYNPIFLKVKDAKKEYGGTPTMFGRLHF